MTTVASPATHRDLIKKVEQVVSAIERADDVGDTIRTVAGGLIEHLRDELGITGGRSYRRTGRDYVLTDTFGEAKAVDEGLRIPRSYPPIKTLQEEGVIFMEAGAEGSDADLEDQLGAREFAAVSVGEGQYLIAFDVLGDKRPEDVVFSLRILRHSINQKIRQERIAGIFAEARRIQQSILPRRPPVLEGFEIAGDTQSMESVGGDFYDYIPISDHILGLAIADVSGHGLPAAMQVRDIYVGLRMGLGREYKILRTVERLNGILHASTLSSRFVSLFYGELEKDGIFIYVNAGHPPPFHLPADGGEAVPLERGGPVLGPVENATYDRGYVQMAPGDLLVLYTDGITEARGRGDGALEEYGPRRLLTAARRHRSGTARQVVDGILEDVRAFKRRPQLGDDQTVVVVKYLGDGGQNSA